MRWRPLVATTSCLLIAVLSCGQPGGIPRETAPPESTASPATEPAHRAADLWYLTRGGAKADQGWGVTVDEAGEVYFATHQQKPGQLFSDMVVYRFTPDGREVWQARWGGTFMEKAFIVTVSEGVAYVGGVSYASANLTDSEMAVIALDADDGHLLWDFTWGQGFGYEEVDGLAVDGDNLYVSGWTTSASTGNDVAVLKLSRSGTLIWESVWGSPDWDQGDGQMVVDQDSIFVAGRYGAKNILLGGQGLLVRFSKDTGAYQEHTTWGGPVGTDALGLTSDGTSLFAVGLTVDEGNGGQIFVRKYDKHLNLIWASLWGGAKSESARAIAVDRQGYIVVAGESGSSGAGGLDLALLRLDPNGHLVWSRVWGGAENEGALGLALDGDVAYIAASTHSFGAGQDDALLLKVDPTAGALPAP